MYKRIISVFLALLMLLSLCACRRKNPAAISESFAGTPVATEAPQASPSPTPDTDTPSPLPTLNWVESEDGSSMTATVPTEDGRSFEITLGVGESDTIFDDESGAGTNTEVSAPATPTPLPLPETTPIPTQNPSEPQAPITDWTGPNLSTTYAEYEAMDGTEQLMFYYSFANAEDFNAWYNAAKANHEANSGDIIIDLP